MASKTRRRSQSVNAVSRKESLISTQFSNSRDNPLFWATTDDVKEGENSEIVRTSKSFGEKNVRNGKISDTVGGGGELRGRSVTRSLSGDKNGIGWSLSRARWRSVSRPSRYFSDESEKGHDKVTSRRAMTKNGMKPMANGLSRSTSAGNRADMLSHAKNARLANHRNYASELSEDDSACSLKISHVEDGISTSSLSEAEERTIKEFYENITLTRELGGDDISSSDLITTLRRNNVISGTVVDDSDVPLDVVDPGAGEFIADARWEYAIELQESEERARKLRADLAIEEHRGQELNRILKEIPPEASSVRKPRRGRRASNERKKMSDRLVEEAMAYFDECVSLSTFDSSDFSASEDMARSSVVANSPIDASSMVRGSSGTLHSNDQDNSFHQKQVQDLQSYNDSLTIVKSSSNIGPTTDIQPYQFSFSAQKAQDLSGRDDDIQSYVKHFERGVQNCSKTTRSYYDAEEYSSNKKTERILIDRLLYKRQIESGELVLCAGSSVSFLPFASIM